MTTHDRIVRDIANTYGLSLSEVEKAVKSQAQFAAKKMRDEKATIHLRYLGKFWFDDRMAKYIDENKKKKEQREEPVNG